MGDNRDDSADSRVPEWQGGLGGPVPWENIGGRAEFITFSLDGTTVWWNPLTWFEALRSRPRRNVAPEQLMATRKPRRPTEPHVERPGPAEFRDPFVRREMAKAAVWLGMALAIVGVDRPRPAAAADHRRRDLRRVPRRRHAPARPLSCRSARGWRLLLTIVLGFGFLGWVFWFAGTTIAAQFEALRMVVTAQFDRLMAFAALARPDAARARPEPRQRSCSARSAG